jgi:hypothetical protein
MPFMLFSFQEKVSPGLPLFIEAYSNVRHQTFAQQHITARVPLQEFCQAATTHLD